MEYISNTAGYLFYEDLVKTLYAKPQGSGFRNPVLDQWTEDAVPGYLDIIKTPMDLGTIKDRLKEGHYNRLISGNPYLDEEGVKRDIRLVFENCMEYNEPDSSFYNDAENLLKIAEQEFGKRDEDLEKEKIADEEERAERNRERAEARKARKREKDRERHAKRYAALKPERDAQRRLKEEMKAKQRAEDERLRAEVEAEARSVAKLANRDRAVRNSVARTSILNELEDVKRRGLLPNVSIEHRKRERNDDVWGAVHRKKQRLDPVDRDTSSISSGEAEELHEEIELVEGETVRDLIITFVSTDGLEKKRGRKSVTVQALEVQHEELMKQRRLIMDVKRTYERTKTIEMTHAEKKALCEKVGTSDYLLMRKVVEILARRLHAPSMLQENEIDVNIEQLDNPTLREIEVLLDKPVLAALQATLPDIESKLTEIEAHYIGIRYQSGAAPLRRC